MEYVEAIDPLGQPTVSIFTHVRPSVCPSQNFKITDDWDGGSGWVDHWWLLVLYSNVVAHVIASCDMENLPIMVGACGTIIIYASTVNSPYSEHNLHFVHYMERQFLSTSIEAFHQKCSLYGDVHYIEYSLYGELTITFSSRRPSL